MAEAVCADRARTMGLAHRIAVDSAGTHAFNIGQPPDLRAYIAVRKRNIPMGYRRARQVRESDFEEFDYILAMDRENYAVLRALSAPTFWHKLHPVMEFAPDAAEAEVPDPYFTGDGGFDEALDLLEAATEGLLAHIVGGEIPD